MSSFRDPAEPAFCFSVQARTDPSVMPRLMELFAKRGLMPSRWHSQVSAGDDDRLSVDIQMDGLDGDQGDYIARCMRQVHGVEVVLTTSKEMARNAIGN